MKKNNYYSIQFLTNIINDRKNNMSCEDILEKYNISSATLNKILTDNNLKIERFDKKLIKSFLNVKETKKERSSSDRIEVFYLTPCSCGADTWIPYHQALRTYKSKQPYLCKKCSLSPNVRYNRASRQIKRKDNTTGYIGVVVRLDHRNGEIYGYQSTIMSEGLTVFRNRYKDEYLKETTLIQAATDRDLYIIEKNLPHRRNFTDMQLISNMEYLGYKEIENIKQKINFI